MKPIWAVRQPVEEPFEPTSNPPVALTPLELGTPMTPMTGSDIADEFAKLRQQNLEGLASDCITYLKSGLTVTATNTVLYHRHGASFGITKELIASTVNQAAELLAKTPSAKAPSTDQPSENSKKSKSKREKS